MAPRLKKTLFDYLVIAISPALIMLLVGSLVLFLAEVFYRGRFEGGLIYVLCLFVFAAVLVARISIEEGRDRAILFGIPLAIVTLLAINTVVKFQGTLQGVSHWINFGLVALIWWSAHKLTWDCTLIDEKEEDTGEGLLQSVGIDRPEKAAIQQELNAGLPGSADGTKNRLPDGTAGQAPPKADGTQAGSGTQKSCKKQANSGALIKDWWRRFVERRRRPHAPGIWIVYFSLAALPLFGIGQIFIPNDNLFVKQHAFKLLAIYTASGLALLLSTSFLGLRRYLRQRQQKMPFLMVNVWLFIGGLLIVGTMSAAMLLPRPNAEYAVSELPFSMGSPDQKASSYAMGNEGIKEDRSDARTEPGDGNRAGAKPSDKTIAAQSDKNKDTKQLPDRQDNNKKSTGVSANIEKQERNNDNRQRQDQTESSEAKRTLGTNRRVSTPEIWRQINLLQLHVVQGIFYGVLAILAFIWLCRHYRELISTLGDIFKGLWGFWSGLFGGTKGCAETGAEGDEFNNSQQHRFADFIDPFMTGTAGRYRIEELVRYTFEALEAWARDHGHERGRDQTPHEFIRSLNTEYSWLSGVASKFADLYCQAAYAPGTLSANSIECVSKLWLGLRN